MLRDRSLITGRGGGGLQNKRVGGSEVLPLKKGGGGNGFSHPEGGRATSFGVVLTWVLEV